jgi:hypothetical protein
LLGRDRAARQRREYQQKRKRQVFHRMPPRARWILPTISRARSTVGSGFQQLSGPGNAPISQT